LVDLTRVPFPLNKDIGMKLYLSVPVAVTSLLFSLPMSAEAANTYTKIADTKSLPFSDIYDAYINNAGTVSFISGTNNLGLGIYTGSGGPIATIADANDPFSPFSKFETPVINNSGTLAFPAFLKAEAGGGSGIFVASSDGSIKTLYDTQSGPFSGFGSIPFGTLTGINDGGRVTFEADLNAGGSGIFTGVIGEPPTQIAAVPATSPAGFKPFVAFPSINNSGTVSFLAAGLTGGPGLYTGNGGSLNTSADSNPSSPFNAFYGNAINNKGTVAFSAGLKDNSQGIFTSSGNQTAKIVDTTGSFKQFNFPSQPNSTLSINDEGTVAFVGKLNAGSTGIFTGPDPVADKVIGTGDLLDDSTVTNLILSDRALNNSDQVVFVATLTDANGTTHEAVYRAEPVPEPRNVAVFGMATFVMLGSAWLRRK